MSPLDPLLKSFPKRKSVIKTLDYLLCNRTCVPCPIFIHGPATTGKSIFIKQLITLINPTHHTAYVNCKSAFAVNLVLTKILRQWVPATTQHDWTKVDSVASFIQSVQLLIPQTDHVYWMFLDDAHILTDSCPTLLNCLSHLVELCGRNLNIVLISNHDWRSFSQSYTVLPIEFSPHTQRQLIDILIQDVNTDLPPKLFHIVTQALVDSVFSKCQNLHILRTGLDLLVKKSRSLMDQNDICERSHVNFFNRILHHLEPDIKEFTDSLYGGTQYTHPNIAHMPKAAKYVLVGSFLASYIPSSSHSKIFSYSTPRDTSNKKRRTTKSADALSQCVLGPTPFTISQMLGIVDRIALDLDPDADVLSHMATLVSLRYVLKSSRGPNVLDTNCKYICNVSREAVSEIAQTVDVKLTEYLSPDL